jgi:hypothetical protein
MRSSGTTGTGWQVRAADRGAFAGGGGRLAEEGGSRWPLDQEAARDNKISVWQLRARLQ